MYVQKLCWLFVDSLQTAQMLTAEPYARSLDQHEKYGDRKAF